MLLLLKTTCQIFLKYVKNLFEIKKKKVMLCAGLGVSRTRILYRVC